MAKLDIFKLRCAVLLLICLLQLIIFGIASWLYSLKDNHLLPVGKFSNDIESNEFQDQQSARLFIAILTHSIRKERREAIRETWMQLCDRNAKQVSCKFFTDDVGLDELGQQALKQEQRQNNDLVILNATGENKCNRDFYIIVFFIYLLIAAFFRFSYIFIHSCSIHFVVKFQF